MDGQLWNILVCVMTFVIFYPRTTLSDDDDKSSRVDDLCRQNIPLPAGYIEIDSIVHPSISTVSYRLYKANNSQPLNWCQSYHACQKVSLNSKLAALSTRELQQSISGLNLTGIDNAWIAGNKQQIGWKWIEDSKHFTDFDPKNSDEQLIIVTDEDHSVCGTINKVKRNTTWVYADLCSSTFFSLCFINGRVMLITTKTNWYDGMNNCSNQTGRLATGSEISQSSVVRTIGAQYWMALHKHPWVWMTSDEDIKTVMYSSWRDASTPGTLGADCMTLNTNGQWDAKPCGDVVDYFICEDGEDPASASSDGSTVPQDKKNLIIGVSVAAALLMVIVIIVVVVYVVLRRRIRSQKKPFANNSPTSSTHLANGSPVNHYIEADHVMNPPDHVSYRPANAAVGNDFGYAEVGQEFINREASRRAVDPADPGPGYVLAKGVDTGKEVYSEVNKFNSGDVTTLVDNLTYAPHTQPAITEPSKPIKPAKPAPPGVKPVKPFKPQIAQPTPIAQMNPKKAVPPPKPPRSQ